MNKKLKNKLNEYNETKIEENNLKLEIKRHIFKNISLIKMIIVNLFILFLLFFRGGPKINLIDNKIKDKKNKKKLKIGIVGVRHEINIGNNLVKYAISKILRKFGYIPYIIGTHYRNFNIEFIQRRTNLVIIKKNFSKEIKEKDYDILMVNSDQSWRKYDNHFYDFGFLRFAKNWNKTKFVYAASIGFDYWDFTPQEDDIIKGLLKNFTGISVREKGSIELIQKHLGITPEFVLDPTLLIDKKDYLEIIKNYSNNNNNDEFIFVYTFSGAKNYPPIRRFLKKVKNHLNYKIYEYPYNNNSILENFIYNISNCKSVVTLSFHGTIMSLIFNKPFVTFNLDGFGKERLKSLGKLFGVENRIFTKYDTPNINLLTNSLNINYTLLEDLRNKSFNFIKKCLGNQKTF